MAPASASPTILVADDDPHVVELVRVYAQREGIRVVGVGDGSRVWPMIRGHEPDLLVLDLMLPGKDGLTLCRELRAAPLLQELPIIMLTAKGEEADRILGLELGADDYVAKPFSPRELVARIKAVLRRSASRGPAASEEPRVFGALSIDPRRRQVTCSGRPVTLRPREFDLLLFLAEHPGRVFTRNQLLEQVWGYDFDGEHRTVDVHIKNLRQKLEPGCEGYIRTVWGVGYAFSPE